MEKPKLIYFDGQGRAEASRWIFVLAGVDYDDARIQYSDWSTLKCSKIFGIQSIDKNWFILMDILTLRLLGSNAIKTKEINMIL